MLITLMLSIALLTIAGLAALPMIRQQIQRDREEEMIHRGTAYMRAIQHFYKKLGRYPTRVEELENTNNLRYLRKRYTDPLSIDRSTGKEKEFKYLHPMDITLNNGPVLPGMSGIPGMPNGQNIPPNAAAALNALQQGGLGNAGAVLGAMQQAGATSNQIAAASDALNPSSSNPSSGNSSDTGGNSNSPGSSPSTSSPGSSSGLSGQVFGGGPILGVASTNKKDKSIREFYGKSKYSDWLFIYLPQAITMGLLTGPVNPNGTPNPNLNGGNLNPPQPGGLPTQRFPTLPPDSSAPAPTPQQ